jgi:hypothetical protein
MGPKTPYAVCNGSRHIGRTERMNMNEKIPVKLTSKRIVKEITPVEVLDEVQLEFDWVPVMENGVIIFQTRVTRRNQTSQVDFQIDLTKLRETELQQVSDFLSRRHADLTSGYEVTRAVVWLLDLALGQQQPGLSKVARDSKIRELLLSR